MQQSQAPGQQYGSQQYGQPAYGQPPQGYGQQPAFGGGGGSFLGTAAAAAAGVVGGSLLLGSIRSMMGGGGHQQSFADSSDLAAAATRSRGAISRAAIWRVTPGSTTSTHPARPASVPPTTAPVRVPGCSTRPRTTTTITTPTASMTTTAAATATAISPEPRQVRNEKRPPDRAAVLILEQKKFLTRFLHANRNPLRLKTLCQITMTLVPTPTRP